MAGLSPIGPLPNDRVEAAFFWSLLHKNVGDWKNQSYESFRAEVATVWPEAADAIKPLTHDDFSHAIYYDVWCKKPWNGRIVALGDAIHGTSPQLGQGVTMALMDADVLAKMIDSDASCENIYRDFWAARKDQLFFVRWTSRFLTPMFQSNSRILSWLRDFAFHFSTKISFIQKFALDTLASQKTNFLK